MSEQKDTNALSDSELNEVAGGTVLPGLQKKSEFYSKADCLFNKADNVFSTETNVADAFKAAGECLDTETGTTTPRGKIRP